MFGAHRSGVTEIAHLNRRGSTRKDVSPGVFRETVQINQDIYFQGFYQIGDLFVALCLGIDEPFKRRLKPFTYRRIIIRRQ